MTRRNPAIKHHLLLIRSHPEEVEYMKAAVRDEPRGSFGFGPWLRAQGLRRTFELIGVLAADWKPTGAALARVYQGIIEWEPARGRRPSKLTYIDQKAVIMGKHRAREDVSAVRLSNAEREYLQLGATREPDGPMPLAVWLRGLGMARAREVLGQTFQEFTAGQAAKKKR